MSLQFQVQVVEEGKLIYSLSKKYQLQLLGKQRCRFCFFCKCATYDFSSRTKAFRRRIEDVLHIDRQMSLSENDPERIAPTIAYTGPVRNCVGFEIFDFGNFFFFWGGGVGGQ